jgi:hypothetical protein
MPPVPPAPNDRPVFPGRDTPLPQPSGRSEADTPPRGNPRGWFDEFTDQQAKPEETEEPQDFGPTGQPTEIPYRFKR